MSRLLIVALVLLVAAASVDAQPAGSPPMGPADIITGARRAQAQKELAKTAETAARIAPSDPHAGVPGVPGAAVPAVDPHAGVAGAPPLAPDGSLAADPHAGVPGAPPIADPHAGVGAAGGGHAAPRRLARPNTAKPSGQVAAGSIRITVVDGHERPAAKAAIRLGVMGSDDKRTSQKAVADAAGVYTFTGLPTGDKQAYRVNVDHQGARFSSTPFRLPANKGYDVVIRRLDTTTATDAVILYVGATSLEFKEERLKVVQQVRLINVTDRTYVFPKGGQRISLPADFVAFQSEKTMGHQTLEEVDGELSITGSLHPGQATLLWGFDIPITGKEQTISLPIPWLTFSYRVLVDAAPGLAMSVDGFPASQQRSDDGRGFLVTELRRRPDDAPFTALNIHLTGIPGPGPLRWIAALLGALAILAGLFVAYRGSPSVPGASAETFEAAKRVLLQRARQLQRELSDGEIGPDYHAGRMDDVTDDLAELLRAEAAAEKSAIAATGASSGR